MGLAGRGARTDGKDRLDKTFSCSATTTVTVGLVLTPETTGYLAEIEGGVEKNVVVEVVVGVVGDDVEEAVVKAVVEAEV